MARPQSPDYDKRRDAIIAAAAELYARRGFQGASVADLAKACRASKSLVYHYFPSKEDILYEVMAAHLELLVTVVEEVAVRPQLGPEDRLHALALSFMRLYEGAASSHKVLLNELDNLPAERRSDVVAKQRRIIAFVGDQVRALRPDLAEIERPLTMLFFGTINWTHTWFRPGGNVSAEQLGELAVTLMLKGLEGVQAS
jgi:AcrR family transcriptional regulator